MHFAKCLLLLVLSVYICVFVAFQPYHLGTSLNRLLMKRAKYGSGFCWDDLAIVFASTESWHATEQLGEDSEAPGRFLRVGSWLAPGWGWASHEGRCGPCCYLSYGLCSCRRQLWSLEFLILQDPCHRDWLPPPHISVWAFDLKWEVTCSIVFAHLWPVLFVTESALRKTARPLCSL